MPSSRRPFLNIHAHLQQAPSYDQPKTCYPLIHPPSMMDNHFDQIDWINFAEYPELAATTSQAENAEQQAPSDWNASKYVDIQEPSNCELPQDLFDDLLNTANLTEIENEEPPKQEALPFDLDAFDWDAFFTEEALALPSGNFSPSSFPFNLEQPKHEPQAPQDLKVDTSCAVQEPVAETIPIAYDSNDFIDWNDLSIYPTNGHPEDIWKDTAHTPEDSYQPSYEYPEPPEPNAPFPLENLYSPANLRLGALQNPQPPVQHGVSQQREVPIELIQQPKAESYVFPPLELDDIVSPIIPDAPKPPKRTSRRLAAPQPRPQQFDASFRVGPQISYDRQSKKKMDPSCDPSHFYTAKLPQLQPWGPILPDGCPLYTYLPQGQLNPAREYTRSQIRHYVQNCPRPVVAWVQQAPAQCNHRHTPAERKCRYANCPDHNRSILPGWLRVAFDESPGMTSNGDKDPFKVAMVMHLWCFEQCFDAVELYKEGKLLPENRQFLRETKNPMAITKNSDAMIISEAFEPWIAQYSRQWSLSGPLQKPREYKDSLSFALVSYHVNNQIQSRQTTRLNRNSAKSKDNWNTIDVHKGDLALYAARSRRRVEDVTAKNNASRRHRKVTQRRHRQREAAQGSNFEVYEYHPSPKPLENQSSVEATCYEPTPPPPMPGSAPAPAPAATFNNGGLTFPGVAPAAAPRRSSARLSNKINAFNSTESNSSYGQPTPESTGCDTDSLFG